MVTFKKDPVIKINKVFFFGMPELKPYLYKGLQYETLQSAYIDWGGILRTKVIHTRKVGKTKWGATGNNVRHSIWPILLK